VNLAGGYRTPFLLPPPLPPRGRSWLHAVRRLWPRLQILVRGKYKRRRPPFVVCYEKFCERCLRSSERGYVKNLRDPHRARYWKTVGARRPWLIHANSISLARTILHDGPDECSLFGGVTGYLPVPRRSGVADARAWTIALLLIIAALVGTFKYLDAVGQ